MKLYNACAEIFLAAENGTSLFTEFSSVEQFISEPDDYIEWYNTKRVKSVLDGLSPVDVRHKSA